MQRFYLSSIVKKLIMSLSGLFLIIFLLVHLGANLTTLISRETYNEVCHFMDTNLLIRIMVPVLALGFIIHIFMAILLTLQNIKARGNDRYAIPGKTDISWASKNMFVLGAIVLGFLTLHLIHFWAKMQLQTFMGLASHPDPYELVAILFRNPLYTIVYLVWIGALWFHLTHGFWSALQSTGLNNNQWMPRLQVIGNIYAWVVCIGFAIIPLFFLLGFNS